jgi:hypothetical protein
MNYLAGVVDMVLHHPPTLDKAQTCLGSHDVSALVIGRNGKGCITGVHKVAWRCCGSLYHPLLLSEAYCSHRAIYSYCSAELVLLYAMLYKTHVNAMSFILLSPTTNDPFDSLVCTTPLSPSSREFPSS